MRLFAALFLFPVVLFSATESVSIDTKTKKVQNPIVNFGTGNTLNGTGATIIGFPGSSYTFIDSLTQSAGNVSLVNDSASPGNSKYYGTDSGGVLGFHTVTGGGGTFIGLDFTGNSLTFMNGTTMWKSTGDSNNTGAHPYTPTTAGIIAKDANGAEIWRLWANDPVVGNSLFIGAHAGENLTDVSDTSVVIGNRALQDQTANNSGNTIIGYHAGESLALDTGVFGFQNTLVGTEASIYTTTRGSGTQNVSQSVGVGGGQIAVGNQTVSVGYAADAFGTNQIIIGSFSGVTGLHLADPDNIGLIGNPNMTDFYFGAQGPINLTSSGASILHSGGLALKPVASPTPTPYEGLVWESSVDHHFYGYNGTTYKQLDNNPTPTATATFTPTPTPTSTPTATATSTATATATATATPTPSATATAYPQGFTAHFSRGGAALQVNDVTLTPWTTKYPGTITGFIISADQGTCTLKVWKKATGTAIPTIADVINTSGVSLATGTHIDSATITDFTTTTVSVGDQFMAQITAVSGGATDITFQIPIRQ